MLVIVAQQNYSLEAGCWSGVASKETAFSPASMAGSLLEEGSSVANLREAHRTR